MVATAAVTGGSGTNCIAGVGVEDTEGGGRWVSACETAVATALLISAIWSAVKVVAELEEDVPATWSRRVFLLACRVNGWLVDLLRGGILNYPALGKKGGRGLLVPTREKTHLDRN